MSPRLAAIMSPRLAAIVVIGALLAPFGQRTVYPAWTMVQVAADWLLAYILVTAAGQVRACTLQALYGGPKILHRSRRPGGGDR
jgi:hypothetical protein